MTPVYYKWTTAYIAVVVTIGLIFRLLGVGS